MTFRYIAKSHPQIFKQHQEKFELEASDILRQSEDISSISTLLGRMKGYGFKFDSFCDRVLEVADSAHSGAFLGEKKKAILLYKLLIRLGSLPQVSVFFDREFPNLDKVDGELGVLFLKEISQSFLTFLNCEIRKNVLVDKLSQLCYCSLQGIASCAIVSIFCCFQYLSLRKKNEFALLFAKLLERPPNLEVKLVLATNLPKLAKTIFESLGQENFKVHRFFSFAENILLSSEDPAKSELLRGLEKLIRSWPEIFGPLAKIILHQEIEERNVSIWLFCFRFEWNTGQNLDLEKTFNYICSFPHSSEALTNNFAPIAMLLSRGHSFTVARLANLIWKEVHVQDNWRLKLRFFAQIMTLYPLVSRETASSFRKLLMGELQEAGPRFLESQLLFYLIDMLSLFENLSDLVGFCNSFSQLFGSGPSLQILIRFINLAISYFSFEFGAAILLPMLPKGNIEGKHTQRSISQIVATLSKRKEIGKSGKAPALQAFENELLTSVAAENIKEGYKKSAFPSIRLKPAKKSVLAIKLPLKKIGSRNSLTHGLRM